MAKSLSSDNKSEKNKLNIKKQLKNIQTTLFTANIEKTSDDYCNETHKSSTGK